jgi:hypothetical protein
VKKTKINKRFFRALVEASHTKGAHYGHREYEAQRILKNKKINLRALPRGSIMVIENKNNKKS